MTKEKFFIYAYDPKIKRRCVYVVINGWAYSLLTGHKFKFSKKDLERLVSKKSC